MATEAVKIIVGAVLLLGLAVVGFMAFGKFKEGSEATAGILEQYAGSYIVGICRKWLYSSGDYLEVNHFLESGMKDVIFSLSGGIRSCFSFIDSSGSKISIIDIAEGCTAKGEYVSGDTVLCNNYVFSNAKDTACSTSGSSSPPTYLEITKNFCLFVLDAYEACNKYFTTEEGKDYCVEKILSNYLEGYATRSCDCNNKIALNDLFVSTPRQELDEMAKELYGG